MEKVINAITCEERQILLFSATFPSWIHQASSKYMKKSKVEVDPVKNEEAKASIDVRHIAIPCNWRNLGITIGKTLQEIFTDFLSADCINFYGGPASRVILFCETKKDCNDLSMDGGIKLDTRVRNGSVVVMS